jgi:hypothetical protein
MVEFIRRRLGFVNRKKQEEENMMKISYDAMNSSRSPPGKIKGTDENYEKHLKQNKSKINNDSQMTILTVDSDNESESESAS